jgi:hypothetical protein
VMGVAEGMDDTGVGTVLRSPVVDRDPVKARQHPGVIDPFGATTVVQRIEGQRAGAGAVKPPPPCASTNACLIEMHDRRAADLLVHTVEEPAEITGAILDERHERPR